MKIVNDRFHEQYHRFLKTLTYYKNLRDTDLLAVTYYLLLQDRIDEAMAAFARVHRDAIPTTMQYDYCAAYLAMFNEKPEQARAIAAAYTHHPVDRWRNTFAAVIAQVDEIEGGGGVLHGDDFILVVQGELNQVEDILIIIYGYNTELLGRHENAGPFRWGRRGRPRLQPCRRRWRRRGRPRWLPGSRTG